MIAKPTWPRGVVPNVTDYDAARAAFSWDAARRELDGLPGGRGLNIAHEAVDRHLGGVRAGSLAFRWIARDGSVSEASYAELAASTNRFANALVELGVGKGDRVFTLLGRVPEMYVTVIGTLKATAVLCPLFSAFGPDPVAQRLERGDARVLVTTPALYRKKVAAQRDALPNLEHVLLVGPDAGGIDGTLAFDDVTGAASDRFEIPPTRPDDMALLHFTSGTTGAPKGAVHVHDAVVAHHATGTSALDLHDDDVFWCTADPGWVTGTSYGVIAPLTHGVTSIVDDGDFDAARWYQLLQDHEVTVWYTAPTALRRLVRAGSDMARELRPVEAAVRGQRGRAAQPRSGGVGQRDVRSPGARQLVADRDGRDHDRQPGRCRGAPGIDGAAAAGGRGDRAGAGTRRPGRRRRRRVGRGDRGPRYRRASWRCVPGGRRCSAATSTTTTAIEPRSRGAGTSPVTWCVVTRSGWMWFVGRADDVIKSSGHLIGPFEVESVLMEHPAVAEAGVIGLPDPVAGEVVKAFVSLRPGFEPSEELQLDLVAFARRRLGAAVAPRSIAFETDLPEDQEREDHAPAPEGARARAGRGRHLDAGAGDMTDAAPPHRRHRPLSTVCTSCGR